MQSQESQSTGRPYRTKVCTWALWADVAVGDFVAYAFSFGGGVGIALVRLGLTRLTKGTGVVFVAGSQWAFDLILASVAWADPSVAALVATARIVAARQAPISIVITVVASTSIEAVASENKVKAVVAFASSAMVTAAVASIQAVAEAIAAQAATELVASAGKRQRLGKVHVLPGG